MACSDQISTEDLLNAKLDAVTLGEVSTSRAGAESGGAPITESTNRFAETTDTIQGRLNKLGVIVDDPIKDWSASLLVSDLRAHRYPATTGDVYVPIKPLPFTTGLTFNSADWALWNGYADIQIENVLINDLSQAYKFATVAAYKAFTTAFPVGKVIHLLDRGAEFLIIAGTGTANERNIVASSQVSQSINIVDNGIIVLSQYGVLANTATETPFINTLLDGLAASGKKFISDIELTVNASLLVKGFRVDVTFLKNITTTSTDPILEIKCNYSKVNGNAVGLTELISPFSPNGIMWIDEESAGNISYNNIGFFQLIGTLQPSGGGSKGLLMRSLDGYTNFTYYNTIHDFKIRNCDTGVFMSGNINANIMQNIILENCGNNQTYTDSAGFFMTEALTAGAVNEGPLENLMSSIFHTASANAVSLWFVGKVYNNHITTYAAETGGASALSFKTTASDFAYGNIVDMTAIAFGGDSVDPVYFENNSYNNSGIANFRSLTSPTIKSSGTLSTGLNDGVTAGLTGLFIDEGAGVNGLTTDNKNCLSMNIKNPSAAARWFDFRADGAFAGAIAVNGGGSTRLNIVGKARGLQIDDSFIQPVSLTGAIQDNLMALGTGSARFSEVFAANGTINTSDERLKQFFDIDQAEKDVALIIKDNIRKFKWNDAIERENGGGKKARLHVGVGAQFVRDTFLAAELNPDDYAFFCYDEWEEESNEEGVTQEAGNRYGIRYSELCMFILSAI